jgi:hypothetical protein
MEAVLNSPLGRTALGQGALRIGRAPDNQLVIQDPQSSAHHAEVAPGFGGNGYQITDLNSTNGTFVNEQRLTPNVPRPLNSGDVVRIGATRFTYEVVSAGYAPTVAASSPNYEPTVAAGSPEAFAPPTPPAYPQPAYTPPAQQSYTPPPPAYPQPAYPQAQPAYPQQGYPQPGGFGQPAYPQPQKKSHGCLWAAIIVILLLVVAGGGGAYYYFQVRSTPQKTLQQYCNDFKTSNANDMYTLLSARNQARATVAQIQQLINVANTTLGGVKDCSTTSVQENGTTATAIEAFTFGDGKTASETDTLVQENGTWKLDSSKANL